MSFFDAAVLGLIQGLTEFIPVSSSGHLILVRDLLNIEEENGLAVDAILQLATALAIAVYFARELPVLFRNKKLVLAIIFGTIPAVLFGLGLESRMETLFRSSEFVAWMLILGSALMYLAEKFAKEDKEISTSRGFAVGIFQSLALMPGMSRSGATISGGLLLGLTREYAARFSFLLALPIILGSGLKKVLDLSSAGQLVELGPELIVGSITAFVSGLWAISFLVSYLKNHKLTPFIYYRLVLALLILVLF